MADYMDKFTNTKVDDVSNSKYIMFTKSVDA